MAAVEELLELEELYRPATITECLAQPMICECGQEYRRGDFWARKDLLICSCGERVGYRCPWVHCEHHIALNRSWRKKIRTGPKTKHQPQPPVEADVALVKSFCRREMVEGGRAYTLEEVGQQDHTTRERVRQIEVAALKRLRAAFIRFGYNADYVQAYLFQVGGDRAVADGTNYAMGGGGFARSNEDRGVSLRAAWSENPPSVVSRPKKPAYSPPRAAENLPLPPSLLPHREGLGRRGRPRRADFDTVSSMTVTERAPSTHRQSSSPQEKQGLVMATDRLPEQDQEPTLEIDLEQITTAAEGELSPSSSIQPSNEGPKKEVEPNERSEQGPSRETRGGAPKDPEVGQLCPEEKATALHDDLRRRRARRGEGLPVPDRGYQPKEPEVGPGEALGAPRGEGELMTLEELAEMLAIDSQIQKLQERRDALAADLREHHPELCRLLPQVLGVRMDTISQIEDHQPDDVRDIVLVEGEPGPSSYGGRVLAHLRGADPESQPIAIADAAEIPRLQIGATLAKLSKKGLVRRSGLGQWKAVER